jgi:hypothetical protein
MKKSTEKQLAQELYLLTDEIELLDSIDNSLEGENRDLYGVQLDMKDTKQMFIKAKKYSYSEYLQAITHVNEAIKAYKNMFKLTKSRLKEAIARDKKLRKEYEKLTGSCFLY